MSNATVSIQCPHCGTRMYYLVEFTDKPQAFHCIGLKGDETLCNRLFVAVVQWTPKVSVSKVAATGGVLNENQAYLVRIEQ